MMEINNTIIRIIMRSFCSSVLCIPGAMAAVNFRPAAIKSVYHSPAEVGKLDEFVDALIRTLDVWDATHGFVVINPVVHGVPVGSVLLWHHLRFVASELLDGDAESRLKASMMSHIGNMVSEQTAFQINYALP